MADNLLLQCAYARDFSIKVNKHVGDGILTGDSDPHFLSHRQEGILTYTWKIKGTFCNSLHHRQKGDLSVKHALK